MIIYGIEIKEGEYENTVSIGGTLFTTDFLNLFCQDGEIMPYLYAIVEKNGANSYKTVTIRSYRNAESAAEYFAGKEAIEKQ